MQISSRAAVVAAFGVGPLLLLAGCGGGTSNAGPEATLARIQPTSFVELPPVTTTTTTSVPVDGAGGGIATGEQQYTIKGGDTLGRIASRYGVGLDQLVGYNEFPNGSSQLILPGDVIKIPPGASTPSAEPVVATDSGATTNSDTASDTNTETTSDTNSDTASDTGGCTHTIVKDENPSRVANTYAITVEELRAANPGGVMDTFLVGATLNIPANGNCG